MEADTEFFCPEHGYVIATFATARVECGRPKCGLEAAPEGTDPRDHRRKYMERRRARRGMRVMRNNGPDTPSGTNGSDAGEAPVAGGVA